MQRVALINGKNKNQDYDISKIFESVATPGVVTGLEVTDGKVSPGYAFIPVSRSGINFVVLFSSSEEEIINTEGNAKVFIRIDQNKIDDGSNNNIDGTEIGSIVVDSDYPEEGVPYIPLASINDSIITDKRKKVKSKGNPFTFKWYDSEGVEQVLDFSDESNMGKVVGIGNVEEKNVPTLISPSVDIHNLESKTLSNETELLGYFGSGNGKFLASDLISFLGLSPFGDGSDGDVTIDAGQSVTLTRDMNYNNLTVNGTLNPNGYIIRVMGTFSGGGNIANEGGVGGNNGGAGGIAGVGGSNGGYGGTGSNGTPGMGDNIFFGTGGGVGGKGGGNGVAGGAFLTTIKITKDNYKIFFSGGTGGGGGTYAQNQNLSGGGGGGGGCIIILANNFSFAGIISVKGGNGGGGLAYVSAGGGGGGGGTIYIFYKSKNGNFTRNIAGGTAGTNGEGNYRGDNGSNGQAFLMQI